MNDKQKRTLIFLGSFSAIVVGGYFLLGLFRGPDPNVEKVKTIQQEFFTSDLRKVPQEELSQKFKEMGEAMKQMTPEQKKTTRNFMMQMFEQEVARYAQLSEKEKVKYLDEKIDLMESMRKMWEGKKNNPANEASKGTSVSGGTSAPSGGTKTSTGATTGGGSAPASAGSSDPGKGGWSKMSVEEKEKRRKEWLDSTTPEFRANMEMLRKDMDKRRQARGLPPSPFGGR